MSDPSKVLDLGDSVVSRLVETRATCPFLGPAVRQRKLAVHQEADNPLASVDDVRQLGNTGGGDLGDLLVLFAEGNHGFMRGQTNKLDVPAPKGFFSLELPASQGSHPGHSGILQGDPEQLASGRFSQADFARLAGHVKDGLLKRSAVGQFIAENLHRDPKAKVADLNIAELLLKDLASFLTGSVVGALKKPFASDADKDKKNREQEQKITKLLGEDNLVGSAGEFGLLFAFLTNSPGMTTVDDEPAVSFEDVRLMFVDKRLPSGWESWKKTRRDWLDHTRGLLTSALSAFRKLRASTKER